jgi:hypothetical protein
VEEVRGVFVSILVFRWNGSKYQGLVLNSPFSRQPTFGSSRNSRIRLDLNPRSQ